MAGTWSEDVTLAVVGGTGFIGSSIVAHCRSAGVRVASLSAPRISATRGPVPELAAWWQRSHGGAFDRLCRALEPFDVVINAAGVATPASADDSSLFGANAVLPSVMARAARVAGVRRLVHVSTAAVQGHLDPLDETPRLFPVSPYTASKAEGERAVLEETADGPLEVVVYRPTSVQAGGRTVMRRLARIVPSLPLVPVAGLGDRPVPVALVENVAAGIVFAATMPEAPPVVLQPWEGITIRRLLELFGARRIVSLPPGLFEGALAVAARPTSRSGRLTAALRRVELVVKGQGVRAEALVSAGFSLPYGTARWEELARSETEGVRAGADPASLGVGRGA